jgi:hypothetical protein
MNSPPDSDGKNEKASIDLFHSILSILSNKVIFIVCLIVIIALIADASLARISDLFSPNLSRISGTMAVFILISIAYFVGQFMILSFVRYRSKEIHSGANMKFYRTYKVTMAVQIALSIIFLFVILQLVAISYYFSIALIATTATSYALAIAMMALLMKSFLSWFRTSKNFVILAYGISAAILVVHLGFTLLLAGTALSEVPTEVRTGFSRPPFFNPGSITFMLDNIHDLSSILSFSMLWAATVLLLHHYSRRVGRTKYWVVVTLPLLYFLSQFPALLLNTFDFLIEEDPFFYGYLLTLVFTLSKPVGGILFGIAFWIMSRSIPRTIAVRDYLTIAALGFVLLFISDQAIVLISIPYPPFGIAAVSIVGLSCYLIFIGIYYCAISLYYDHKVRHEIKKFAIQESNLLGSSGSAQLEKDITKKVIAITKRQDFAAQNLGVSSSLDQEDIKKYVEEVLHELKARKKEGQA